MHARGRACVHHRERITSLTVYAYTKFLESQSAHSGTPRIIIIIHHHHHPSRARVVADASVFETSRARRAYLVNVIARGARDVERRRRRCDSNEGGKKENARAHFGRFGFDLDLIRTRATTEARKRSWTDGASEVEGRARCDGGRCARGRNEG